MAAAAIWSCPLTSPTDNTGAGGVHEGVVPVTADLGGLLRRLVTHRDGERVRCGRLRQRRALQDLRHLPCRVGGGEVRLATPHPVERLGALRGDALQQAQLVLAELALGPP